MRHHKLAGATFAIAAVFILAAIVFAGRFSTIGAPDAAADHDVAAVAPAVAAAGGAEGAAYFQARCGRCHDRGDFAAWARAHPDPTARGQWLGKVLQKHAPPPEQERAAIIGHIQQSIEDSGH